MYALTRIMGGKMPAARRFYPAGPLLGLMMRLPTHSAQQVNTLVSGLLLRTRHRGSLKASGSFPLTGIHLAWRGGRM